MANFIARPLGADEERELPATWVTSLLGPGWPIQPVGQPEDQIPREIEYPPAVNVSIVPRTHYGLRPFAALRAVYENVSEVSQIVRLLQREMTVFIPQLWDKQTGDLIEPGHEWFWLVESPDRENPFTVWLERFLESLLVYDAPAVFIQRDEAGYLRALRVIDGSTLMRLIDDRGRIPRPPAPAFVQIIQGMPLAWFTTDEIWYRPRFPRLNNPYGFSPIEDCWDWVMLVASLKGYELAFYREGNMPEGVVEAPPGLSWQQIAKIEDLWNRSMLTTMAARRRWRFMPNGFRFTPLKVQPFPVDLYREALSRIGIAFGVPASELGVQPGATLGRGMVESMRSTLFRAAISPLKSFVEGFFNEILGRFNLPFVFSLDLPPQEIDPEKRVRNVLDLFSFGLLTMNQALQEMGYPTVPGGDVRFVTRGGYVVRLDDFLGGVGVPALDGESPPQGTPETEPLAPPMPPAVPRNPTPKPLRAQRQAIQQQLRGPMHNLARQQRGIRRGRVIVAKHCGVCEDDEVWYRAPVAGHTGFHYPSPHHANEVNIVSIRYRDESRPALFKPAAGEKPSLREWVGGPLYVREEAAYLLDRMFGFLLVPVAWVGEVDGEVGAIIHYTREASERRPARQYDPGWILRAAILDYVAGQLDRIDHNWFTHPEEPGRPVLYDNGLTFPTKPHKVRSSFVLACHEMGMAVGPEEMGACIRCLRDVRGWERIQELVGEPATLGARNRLLKLMELGRIPDEDVGT